MTEEELYTQTAQDYAEMSEYWARQSRRHAKSIDLPGAMFFTSAVNLLIFSILLTIVLRGVYAQYR